MSFAHMKAVMDFEAGAVTGTRLLLLVYLANCANDQGVCWPSKVQILEKTGIDDKTFRKALADLESIGAVAVERKVGRGITYTVALPTEKRQSLGKRNGGGGKNPATGKFQSLENSSGGGGKNPVGSLENSSGVTGKIPPKSINNLSIIYQEPTNNTREENFVESADSPKNLSDQKLDSEEKEIVEENLDIEEALSQIPFSDGDFVAAVDSEEVSEGTGSQKGVECAKNDLNESQGTTAKKARKTKKPVAKVTKPENVSPEVWEQWLGLKKAKSKYVSQLMVTAIEREAQKAGISTEEAMQCQLEHGWTGFKAEWYENQNQRSQQQQRPRRKSRFSDVPNTDDFEAGLLGLN